MAFEFPFLTTALDAFDFGLMKDTLKKLKEGKPVEIPIYDFKTHTRYLKAFLAFFNPCFDRSSQKKVIYGANVVVFEGILIFYDKDVRDLMDMKIFVDTDDDVRLSRRCKLIVKHCLLIQNIYIFL